MNTTVDKIKESGAQRDRIKAIGTEMEEEYADALNRIASSEDGKFFLKSLMIALGINKPLNYRDNLSLIKQTEQRNVYLEKIRPYLKHDVRKDLES